MGNREEMILRDWRRIMEQELGPAYVPPAPEKELSTALQAAAWRAVEIAEAKYQSMAAPVREAMDRHHRLVEGGEASIDEVIASAMATGSLLRISAKAYRDLQAARNRLAATLCGGKAATEEEIMSREDFEIETIEAIASSACEYAEEARAAFVALATEALPPAVLNTLPRTGLRNLEMAYRERVNLARVFFVTGEGEAYLDGVESAIFFAELELRSLML